MLSAVYVRPPTVGAFSSIRHMNISINHEHLVNYPFHTKPDLILLIVNLDVHSELVLSLNFITTENKTKLPTVNGLYLLKTSLVALLYISPTITLITAHPTSASNSGKTDFRIQFYYPILPRI